MIYKKEITEEKALSRLAALCSRGEHCTGELSEKMQRWNLSDEAQARIMAFLTEHHYVDDTRYARAFIHDKVEYNKWGRKKIEQALWAKNIDESVYAHILDEIEENVWEKTLFPLLLTKEKSIKAENDYERNVKLLRFALSRGFSMDTARRCIEEMDGITER